MKTLSWNIHGLGKQRTFDVSKKFETYSAPNFVSYGNKGYKQMNRDNKKAMWIYERFSKSHIDVEVEEEKELVTWRFTGFYGVLVEHDRKESWKLLRVLKHGSNKP
ncbi:reverse transcriptase [Gossypium australe]|uniref:Reverse transcriptase n=1 Tax=Gossypium australe TaxID=47621 RepID=A0A5B6VP89_9ROSI|nr:reverse transcriptase [Gossypium australe]